MDSKDIERQFNMQTHGVWATDEEMSQMTLPISWIIVSTLVAVFALALMF